MLVLCSVSPGKEGLITDLKQKSSDYFLSVFVPYRYSDSGNLTAGRCPGSKALVFYRYGGSRVTVPNVNIGDCDYTIAFWIRLVNQAYWQAVIWGSPRSGKFLFLTIHTMHSSFCHQASITIGMTCMQTSSDVNMNNWTHVVVTCEQDNRVKVFFNGEIGNNITTASHPSPPNPTPPKETFFIDYFARPVIMDLHILGFALRRDEIYDLYRG